MTKYRNYNDNDFITAIRTSRSIRQVLLLLNLAPQGGNYRTVHSAIKRLHLDTSHFTGKGWKIRDYTPTKSINEYLSNKYPITSHKLKKRLIKENILKPICSSCNILLWLNQPMPLELDHIDGNHDNNNLDNLRLLCPNCHALTSTYCRKKKL